MKDQIALATFIDELVADKKDPSMNEHNMVQMKQLLLQEVNDEINTHLVSLLSDQDQMELDKMLQNNATDDQLNSFFTEKIPNLEAEIATVLLNFRAAYLLPNEPHSVPNEPSQESNGTSLGAQPPPLPPAPVAE